jgi:hypothetical protein
MSCGDLLIEEMSSQVVNLGCKIQHYVTAVNRGDELTGSQSRL